MSMSADLIKPELESAVIMSGCVGCSPRDSMQTAFADVIRRKQA